MDYSPYSEREIWPNLKRNKISETREATPTKIDLHTFHINLYLHEFIEPIPFLTPMDYSPWSEGKLWPFLKANEKSHQAVDSVLAARFHAYTL